MSNPIDEQKHLRLPSWLRQHKQNPGQGRSIKQLLRRGTLSTVCEEARCPNVGQCFDRGTATFLIMGDHCSRGCRFCNVTKGRAEPLDRDEPERLAQAAVELKLKHVVITSVTRDDLDDGGAGHFAAVIKQLRIRLPKTTIEVLVPDFAGSHESVRVVLDAGPDVFNHNIETIERLYAQVRPGAVLQRSLQILSFAKAYGRSLVKSGLMVGLGETDAEVYQILQTLADSGVDIATVGQYLRPQLASMPVQRYVEPEQFEVYRRVGLEAGLLEVFAGPLVRSSYMAEQIQNSALAVRQGHKSSP